MISRRCLLAAGLWGGFSSAGGAAEGAVAQAGPIMEAAWSHNGLAGTLTEPGPGVPVAEGGRLGVLILAGSGPTDRDGNGPGLSTDLYRKLAQGLAAAGHVVLRYDKRGVAGSRAAAVREEDLTFPLMVEDARAACTFLKARGDVKGVVPVGHSEGAMIAIRLASSERVAGLVLMAAPGRSLDVILKAQLEAAGTPAPLMAEIEAILARLARGERVNAVPAVLAPLFRPSVQPYLISQITIDPARELGQVRAPCLILAAGRDLQVGAEDFDRLRQARPDARAERLATANHVFKSAPAERAGNVALYGDAAAPLHPGLLPAILSFLAGLG